MTHDLLLLFWILIVTASSVTAPETQFAEAVTTTTASTTTRTTTTTQAATTTNPDTTTTPPATTTTRAVTTTKPATTTTPPVRYVLVYIFQVEIRLMSRAFSEPYGDPSSEEHRTLAGQLSYTIITYSWRVYRMVVSCTGFIFTEGSIIANFNISTPADVTNATTAYSASNSTAGQGNRTLIKEILINSFNDTDTMSLIVSEPVPSNEPIKLPDEFSSTIGATSTAPTTTTQAATTTEPATTTPPATTTTQAATTTEPATTTTPPATTTTQSVTTTNPTTTTTLPTTTTTQAATTTKPATTTTLPVTTTTRSLTTTKPATTTTPVRYESVIFVLVVMRVTNRPFTDALRDPFSTEFNDLVILLSNSIMVYSMRVYGIVVRCTAFTFREGSIIAHFKMSTPAIVATSVTAASDVTAATADGNSSSTTVTPITIFYAAQVEDILVNSTKDIDFSTTPLNISAPERAYEPVPPEPEFTSTTSTTQEPFVNLEKIQVFVLIFVPVIVTIFLLALTLFCV